MSLTSQDFVRRGLTVPNYIREQEAAAVEAAKPRRSVEKQETLDSTIDHAIRDKAMKEREPLARAAEMAAFFGFETENQMYSEMEL